MTGNEFLRALREDKHMTVRGFATLCGFSPRTVSYYENGQNQISSIPSVKAIKMFGILGADIEQFFDDYYPYKDELDKSVLSWRGKHPKTLKRAIVKKRYYQRLAKIKERGNLAPDVFDGFMGDFRDIFDVVLADDVMTEDDYDRYILEFNYRLRKALNPLPDKSISHCIMDGLYHTEYSISDISKFCGVNGYHIRGCIEGTYDIETLRVGVALKICYVLHLSFNEVFGQNISF